MPSWGDLLGSGTVAEQLLVWGVLNQLLGELLGPALEVVAQQVNKRAPVAVIPPADLASAVVRNFMDRATAAGEAAQSGVDGDRFDVLTHLAGDAPAPFQLAEALRRGIIEATGTGPDSTSFLQGIAEGRLNDKWADTIRKLAVEWPTPADALQALLQGQVDQATAQALYQRFGGDPDYFQLLFDTRGNAPTPVEALQMANRRIIPWTGTGPDSVSYEQAFLEGPWRNKWLGPFEKLGVYVPPPRTVTTLLNHGVITEAQAQQWFQDTGMTPDTAAAYVRSATAAKLTTNKHLTQANVEALYLERLITDVQARAMLGDLGYGTEDVDYILESWDFARARAAYQSAVTRVGAFYTGRKIDRPSAVKALQSLDVPAAAVTELMAAWDAELAVTVKEPTPAEIRDLVVYGVKDNAWGLAELVKLGYTEHGAWVSLSARLHTAAGDEPPIGPTAGGVETVV